MNEFLLLLMTFAVPGPVRGGTGHAEVRDTHPTLRNGGDDPKIENHHPGEGLGNGQIQGTT